MSTKSLRGSLHFITFIDDNLRKCWAYLLKDKTEVFATFRNFHAFITAQPGLKLKYLMTDNGLGVDHLITICLHPAERNQDVDSDGCRGSLWSLDQH